MDGRAKRNVPDDAAANAGDKDDVTTPTIPEALISAFLAALTGAITTTVTTAVSTVRPVPTPR